jgi:hypothetical protein
VAGNSVAKTQNKENNLKSSRIGLPLLTGTGYQVLHLPLCPKQYHKHKNNSKSQRSYTKQ